MAFLMVEALFATFWPEFREDPIQLGKWRGFFDGYYVLLPIAVTMFVVRDWVFANATPAEEPFLDNPLRGLGFIPARLTAARVWGSLLCKLIWPVKLSADYSYNEIPLYGYPGVTTLQNFVTLLWVVALLATLAIAAWLLWRGHKALCFFVLLYLINYFPTSNFGKIIGSITAERFMYLPLIGFAAIVAIVVSALSRRLFAPMDSNENGGRHPAWPHLVHVALLLLAVAYGCRAFLRKEVRSGLDRKSVRSGAGTSATRQAGRSSASMTRSLETGIAMLRQTDAGRAGVGAALPPHRARSWRASRRSACESRRA